MPSPLPGQTPDASVPVPSNSAQKIPPWHSSTKNLRKVRTADVASYQEIQRAETGMHPPVLFSFRRLFCCGIVSEVTSAIGRTKYERIRFPRSNSFHAFHAFQCVSFVSCVSIRFNAFPFVSCVSIRFMRFHSFHAFHFNPP